MAGPRGGIETIDDIKQRCELFVDEKGREHWLWAGRMRRHREHHAGLPIAVYQGTPNVSVRRVLLKLSGRKLGPTMVAICKCDYPDCVSPGCTTATLRSAHVSRIHRGGEVPPQTLRALQAANAGRRRLTPEQVMAIYRSQEPTKLLAEQYGLSRHTIWDIRRGQRYRDITQRPVASVFGLAAAGAAA